MYLISMENEITNWVELTRDEKDDVLVILASIFTLIGADEDTAANWYNSGYIRLFRNGNKRIIKGMEGPTNNSMYNLAVIEVMPTEPAQIAKIDISIEDTNGTK